MKKCESTRIRLNEYERENLEETSRVTGLPFSACIRVLIASFINDFKRNEGTIRFPLQMNAAETIWESIQAKYSIPPYVTAIAELADFLDLMHKQALRNVGCPKNRETL